MDMGKIHRSARLVIGDLSTSQEQDRRATGSGSEPLWKN